MNRFLPSNQRIFCSLCVRHVDGICGIVAETALSGLRYDAADAEARACRGTVARAPPALCYVTLSICMPLSRFRTCRMLRLTKDMQINLIDETQNV